MGSIEGALMDNPTEQMGAPARVYAGVMRDLEEGRVVPGQRLAETDLALRFEVGRNAVREAMQRLALRGVVEFKRFHSASIRQFDVAEAMEVLDVASALTVLAATSAARNFEHDRHHERLQSVTQQLSDKSGLKMPGGFSAARRSFYRTLLGIANNRELIRLFPAIGMHIIFSQFRSEKLRDMRVADYIRIIEAIRRSDPVRAKKAVVRHVESVRNAILRETSTGLGEGFNATPAEGSAHR